MAHQFPRGRTSEKHSYFSQPASCWRTYTARLPPCQALLTFPDLTLSYCHTRQLGKAMLMVFTGSYHVTDWVCSHWGCWQTSIKWMGQQQPITKITVPLNLWKFVIINHMHHLNQRVVECSAALRWIKLVKIRSWNNSKKTTWQKI